MNKMTVTDAAEGATSIAEPTTSSPSSQSADPGYAATPPEAEETAFKSAATEALIAEAERRGYLRGRNEALAERLSAPDMLAEPGVAPGSEAEAEPKQQGSGSDELSSRFLSRIRPSVWDL